MADPWSVQRNRLRNFRLDCRFTDFTICCEWKEIKVHKAVLASASAYFDALFARDTEESRENRLKWDVVKLGELELVIDYMYMCEVDLDWYDLEPALEAARRFQLEGFERFCVRHMTDKLSSENCLEYIERARKIRLDDLEQEAFRYALKNFEAVVNGKYFPQINVELLTRLVESDDLEVKDESDVFEAILTWFLQDEMKRKLYLEKLIKLVRLTFITPEKLGKLSCYNEIWESSPGCGAYLTAVIGYHHPNSTHKWKPAVVLSSRLNTKPRILQMRKNCSGSVLS